MHLSGKASSNGLKFRWMIFIILYWLKQAALKGLKEAGEKAGVELPKKEETVFTNFIR